MKMAAVGVDGRDIAQFSKPPVTSKIAAGNRYTEECSISSVRSSTHYAYYCSIPKL